MNIHLLQDLRAISQMCKRETLKASWISKDSAVFNGRTGKVSKKDRSLFLFIQMLEGYL